MNNSNVTVESNDVDSSLQRGSFGSIFLSGSKFNFSIFDTYKRKLNVTDEQYYIYYKISITVSI